MKQVLLIDDDSFFVEQLARSLSRRGWQCVIAANAEAALEQAYKHAFDAVSLDLNLAGESGLSLITPLREQLPEAQIVLLTGYASVATAVEAIKRGADNYLPKPASVSQILNALAGLPTVTQDEFAPEQMLRLRRLEWEHIQQALRETEGNISAAARILGMHRRTLQRKLDKRPISERDESNLR